MFSAVFLVCLVAAGECSTLRERVPVVSPTEEACMERARDTARRMLLTLSTHGIEARVGIRCEPHVGV